MKNILSLLFSAFLILACSSGDNESMEEIEEITLATVSTNEIKEITQNSAISGGDIDNNGGSDITAKGVCWSKETSPTILDNLTSDGTGNSSFSSTLSELEDNTEYFLRAYSTNSKGTSYGNEITFKTLEIDPIVGVWTEKGNGTVFLDGSEDFSPYTYFCITLGRFTFENDGTFEIKTFDGPDDGCFSTGVLTGTWIKNGDLYTLKAVSDTAENSEAGQEAELRILFPNDSQMQWISESDSAEIDYSYELYELVE
tara:strand:+ start:107 stop:874 length:768 start_codon:yes stop_codon:yes gene_type:complete